MIETKKVDNITRKEKVMMEITKVKSVFFKNITKNFIKNNMKNYNIFFSFATKRNLMLVIILFLSTIILNNIGITGAYYRDKEDSLNNILTTGTLDFTITDSGFSSAEGILNFQSGIQVVKSISAALEPNNNPMKYKANATNMSGDLSFCNEIDLDATFPEGNHFSGKLMNFDSNPITALGNWEYSLSLPSNQGFYNSVCTFDFNYNGRQTAPHNEYATSGYEDTETASNTLYSWGLRINKVYYDVDSAHGVEGENEWVEVYNQTDTPLDISGWSICDNDSCDTIPANTPLIPSHGFALITNSATTWNYYDIPNDVVKIVLGSDINNELDNNNDVLALVQPIAPVIIDQNVLDNNNDMLVLKRPDGVIIDQMNYGNTPNSGWVNYNSDIWEPGGVDVAEGNMLGRISNGYDTNQSSDFVELKAPTVAMVNPIGGELWYVGHQYDVQWTAHSNNTTSTDADLKISLWYSADSGATWVKFASNLNNTGSYRWTLPLFIGSYYMPSHISRIKAIAVGPENFMVQASGSSDDFCPPIDYDALSLSDQQLVDQMVLDGLIPASDVIKGGVHVVGEVPKESPVQPQENSVPEVVEDAVTNIINTVQTVINQEPEPEVSEPLTEEPVIEGESETEISQPELPAQNKGNSVGAIVKDVMKNIIKNVKKFISRESETDVSPTLPEDSTIVAEPGPSVEAPIPESPQSPPESISSPDPEPTQKQQEVTTP